MTDAPLLVAEQLGRRYGARDALAGVDLTLERGTLLGLLGVNGAGKSTLIKLLAGVIAPTSGRVRVEGHDLIESPRAARARIGYAPETPPLYPELTVSEYLAFCARLRGLAGGAARRARDDAIGRLELGAVARRVIGALSRGFQQRVNLAQAQLHAPPLLLLDEPTAGLDPVQSRAVMEYVRTLSTSHGVILSTHHLSEVRDHCARALILDGGRVAWSGAIGDLAAPRALRVRLGARADDAFWDGLDGLDRAERLDDFAWMLHAARTDELERRIAAHVHARGALLVELAPARDGLEQRFLAFALAAPGTAAESATAQAAA